MTRWVADLERWDQLSYPERREAGSMLLFCPSSNSLFFSVVDNMDDAEFTSAHLDLLGSTGWRR